MVAKRCPNGRFSVSGLSCSSDGCLITGQQFDSGRSAGVIAGPYNFDLSPASTGVLLWCTPGGGVRLERPPPLPSGAVQPVDVFP